MKRTDKNALRAKDAGDLRKEIDELRTTLFKARFSTRLEGKVMGVKARATRRRIATLNTLIAEKARAQPAKA